MLVAFNPQLTGYHEIRANSYQTEEWYNDIGKFTLIVPPTNYNIQHLVKGAILYRNIISQAMIITRVSPDTSQDRITVNGYTTNWLLNKRTITSPAVITTVESGIYAAVNANLRSLPNVQTAPLKALSEMYSAILFGGQLLDEFIPILDAIELGQRMRFDTKTRKHIFEIYKGNDLTIGSHAVIFSDEQGTARDLKIEDDESLFKNVIYVLGRKAEEPVKQEVPARSDRRGFRSCNCARRRRRLCAGTCRRSNGAGIGRELYRDGRQGRL